MNKIFILVLFFVILNLITDLIKQSLKKYINNDFLSTVLTGIILLLFALFYGII